ncbi:hypothetical protein ACGFIW_01375 [Micromonospora sp. NPDC048935]|uniref:hypothetical protein n=1 Tax=Micromonospora sp. NPDC048935 TaxID=3364262 RepID=UPI003718D089
MSDNQNTPEIIHPDWCQRDRCVTHIDGSVTHGHLFGTIAADEVEIDVTVERTDAPDEKGKVKAGPARAYTRINRTGVMSAGSLDRVTRLMDKATAFSGQRMGRY